MRGAGGCLRSPAAKIVMFNSSGRETDKFDVLESTSRTARSDSVGPGRKAN